MIDAKPNTDLSRQGAGARPLILAMTIGMLAFLPSAARYVLNTTSLAAGTLVACSALVLMALAGVINTRPDVRLLNQLSAVALILFGVAVHYAVTLIVTPSEVARMALSLAGLALALVGGLLLHRMIFEDPHAPLARALLLLRAMIIVIAVMALVGLQPPSNLSFVRPVFPFSEPSHFAFTCAPFIVDACVRDTQARRVLWLLGTFLLAYFLQSLSLIVAGVLAAFICLPAWQSGLVAIAAFVAAGSLDIEYFTDRLDLSADTQNLSSLVYRQGWDSAWESLKFSDGWGIGFQQLGFAPVHVPTSDAIHRIMGEDMSREDGSFVAAKLMSEFGVLGIAVFGVLVILAITNALRLRRVAAGRLAMSDGLIFASSIVVAYLVEMVVRGAGYFSGTTVLLVAALIAVHQRYGGRGRRKAEALAPSPARA